MKRIAVLDDYQDAVSSLPYWARLAGRASVDVYRDTPSNEGGVVRRLREYEIVVPIRERTRFPASLLEGLPALELLALTGRNSGHVDVEAIVGLGRIGSRIAAFGKFLGMRVLAWGPTLDDERAAAAGARRVSLDDLFRESDVVSVHLRLSDQTRGIIQAQHLSLMKPAAYFINTARGPLVDEKALIAALQENRIAGAALDVYELEPLPERHPLRSCQNAVLSPHMGFVTREAYHLFFSQAVEAIDNYLQGKLPPRALNPEVFAHRMALAR